MGPSPGVGRLHFQLSMRHTFWSAYPGAQSVSGCLSITRLCNCDVLFLPSLQPLAANTMSSSTSQVPATSFSSSFQLIFNTALKDYEKKTKRDLLANPLVSQLQACDSPASILAVLQGQVEDMDTAQKSDERLTKWLSPTVNVLLTFSATIGGGVSLVRIKCSRCRTTI